MVNRDRRNIFWIVIFLAQLRTLLIFSQDYGLNFNGQNVILDDRTELNLTPDGFLELKNEFEISFDMKVDFNQPIPLFGYVLRIINEDNQNIDLLFSNRLLDPTLNLLDRKLNLIIGNTETLVPLDNFNFSKENWVNIHIKFLLSKKQLIFYISDSEFIKRPLNFKDKDAFKILFGANSYKQFTTSDVPEMSIRDIKLSQKGKLLYHYPLNQCGGSTTLDLIKKQEATVKNANWLLCKHEEWQQVLKSETKGVLLVTSDEGNGDVFMLKDKELLIYSSLENNTKTVKYKNGPILLTLDHRAIFNSLDGKIYCYLADKNLYSSLDIKTGVWSNHDIFSNQTHQQLYKHHNSVFNPSDNSIYTFGGYGQYKYHNELRKVNLNNESWEELKTNNDIFQPRYLAGASIINDTIYILGGYGSSSGNQLINPKSYYNLLGYSIGSGEFIKKFEVPKLIDDMIVANSMWIDSLNRNYYALISDKIKFEGYLQLLKGNLDRSDAELVGGTIPYKFLDIKSFSGLYFFPNQNKLFAYTTYLTDANTSEFNLYSIAYPPIIKKEPYIKSVKANKSSKYIIITLIILLIVSSALWFVYSNRKTKRKLKEKEVEKANISSENEANYIPNEIDFNPISEKLDYQIIFFGGFQVFDKQQNDITNKFSPLLKELFLLIWLYTFKNNKGISSAKLVEILWYDKSSRRAQNNRSVNITKLRMLIKEIGGCELTKKTGYWKIVHNHKELKSDYYELLHIIIDKKNISKDRIDHVINITKKGGFLSNLEYEWLDEFKADISEKIINTLLSYAELVDIKSHPNFTIRLADCVFNFDSINEEAMIYKCKAQYLLGKHSLALGTFNKFTKEYKILYGQEYETSFTDILGQKN